MYEDYHEPHFLLLLKFSLNKQSVLNIYIIIFIT